MTKTTEERFWPKVARRGDEECWLWIGSIHVLGYADFWDADQHRLVKAHRYAYELLVGPVPAGMEVDHLCRVRHCVNPAHLEAVTPRENNLRSDSPAGRNARKTHCKHGHELSGANLMWRSRTDRKYVYRECRECRRIRKRVHKSAA